MKLKNPVLQAELRKFYTNEWTHREIQAYLRDHYELCVSRRTLIRWKQCLRDPTWQGPVAPKPPIHPSKVSDAMLRRIMRLRVRTGWGRALLKAMLPYDLSESTYRDLIREYGLSRGSKIENKRIRWVKWQRNHPDSTWQLDATQRSDRSWELHIIDDCSRYSLPTGFFKTMTRRHEALESRVCRARQTPRTPHRWCGVRQHEQK